MNSDLVQYIARLAQSHIETRDAVRRILEQVSTMTAFDPTPIVQQIAEISGRVSQQGEQIQSLIARMDSADSRIGDQTAVITALAGRVAEIQQAGQADLSGLPAL